MDNPRSLMRSSMHQGDAPRALAPGTLRRIGGFAAAHRSKLASFLALSTVSAILTVATPVLAGRVVDGIVNRAGTAVVVGLAVLIALLAIVDAGVGLVARWQSARIGEGLILDLRRAVFTHVQRMPIAFFTRTRTGALVSRLNNDVIGAQSALTSTLSGLVTNVIQLVLTLAVMLMLSWQVTALALLLLPVFLLPARAMGARLAEMRREASVHNAAMTTQMTERFSAPGATLVKLFGRPDEEAGEFGERASRVRDIGVRTAMATRVFLTALANARVDIMTALIAFERVFEVLDVRPTITEVPDPRGVPAGPVAVEFDRVRFGYPSADQVSLASLEEVAVLDIRGGEEVLHGVDFPAGPGQLVA